jgi:hypothetical protein
VSVTGDTSKMITYTLQKAIRNINRDPGVRQAFQADPQGFANGLDMADDARAALVARDYRTLYRMGVHGLLLRPFSILHGVSEPEYLRLIREQP